MLRRSRGARGLLGLLALAPAAWSAPASGGPPLDLHLGGRLQVDHSSYFAAGAAEAGLRPTFQLKRFNIELLGDLTPRWQLVLQAELGTGGLDASQGPALRPAPAVAYLGHRLAPELNVQAGQVLAPITLENRTLSKEKVHVENGLVQQLGAPSPLEIGAMAWGEVAGRSLAYEAGVFNGDGANRLSPDARVDLIARLRWKPLAAVHPALRDAHLGGSLRMGSRDPARVHYDHAALLTQGGFRFWRPTHEGPEEVMHLIPAGDQLAIAAEASVPIDRLELTAELVHARRGTREAPDSARSTPTGPTGTLSGTAGYAQLGVWVTGSRDILDPAKAGPPGGATALQVIGRAEALRVRYEDEGPGAGPAEGSLQVGSLLLGVRYWWSPHVRTSVNHCMYSFSDTAALRGLHELLFRLEASF